MRLGNLNFSRLLHLLSGLTIGSGVFMLIPFLVALAYGEGDAEAHLLAAIISLLLGGVIFKYTKKSGGDISHREGIAFVALCWLLLGPLGALPFYFYAERPVRLFPERAKISAYAVPIDNMATHGYCEGLGSGGPGSEFCSPANCLFESISGITSTGSSILGAPSLWQSMERTSAEELPHGIQLWRHLIHLMGGMGIIILSLAVMPLLGASGMQLFRAELSGPAANKFTPKIAETARWLWSIYLALTLVQIILLRICGIPLFSAICFAFTTISTGGFAPLADSSGGLNNPAAEWTMIIIMIISSLNFTLHFMFMKKKFNSYTKDPECRAYISTILVVSLLLAFILFFNNYHDLSFASTFRVALFHIVSIISSTGLAATDFGAFDSITPLTTMIFIAISCIGGCAGSTAGGLKFIRVQIAFKYAGREIYRLIHPKAIANIRIGNRAVSQKITDSIFGFFAFYIATFTISMLFITAHGHDITTAASSTIASLSNTGVGVAKVGPSYNYNYFSTDLKLLFTLLMVMGRLEIINLLALFSLRFWKK